MKRNIVFASVLVLLVLMCLAPAAFGQVQTRIRVIQASNAGQGIEPSLEDVHHQLGAVFNFTSYRLLRDETVNLGPGQSAEIPVHPGRSIIVKLLGHKRETAGFRVRIRREGQDILNTQVRLSPGRSILIGGPQHGEGVVILALSARF